MKKGLFLLVAAVCVNAQAIEFITEAQVEQKLGAQKVIEITKYSVESLIENGSDCAAAYPSRSARAYVVKKGNAASLYLTQEGLKDLVLCRKL